MDEFSFLNFHGNLESPHYNTFILLQLILTYSTKVRYDMQEGIRTSSYKLWILLFHYFKDLFLSTPTEIRTQTRISGQILSLLRRPFRHRGIFITF